MKYKAFCMKVSCFLNLSFCVLELKVGVTKLDFMKYVTPSMIQSSILKRKFFIKKLKYVYKFELSYKMLTITLQSR